MAESHDNSIPEHDRSKPTVDREKFGGTHKDNRRDGRRAIQRSNITPEREDQRAPKTSAEMLKDGPTIADRSGPKVNWQVLIIASVIIFAFSLWAIFAPR